MAKKNFYACKGAGNHSGIVFDNWEECQKYVRGKNIQYQGFQFLSDAEEYAGLKPSPILLQLDTTPISNPNQTPTHAISCMSVDEYCHKFGFDYFTKEQRVAVGTTDGKALLFAVPGSGKTTVIILRTGYLIHACNINPKEIVSLTFTKAAAEEMENRYYESFPADKGLVNFRTIHSFCWNVILPELRAVGFQYPKHLIGGTNQSQNDGDDITQAKIIKRVLRECCNYSKTNDEVAQNKVMAAITGVKNNITLPEDLGTIYIQKKPIKVRSIYCYYQKLLEENGALDFDDMLRYSYKGLHEHPEVLFSLQARFKYWSIDEAQDNSELQYELLKMLVGENGNLYMVGDDDQSIYSFRAAKPSLMFEKFGSQPCVKRLYMSTNFRSDKSIVNSAKNLISMNIRRELKDMKHRIEASDGRLNVDVNFINEHAEYEFITEKALESIKKNDSLAVLYRFNASSLPIVTYFHKNNIPYKSSKSITDILSGLTVKQVFAFLECSQKQKDFKTVYNKLRWLDIYLNNEKYSKEIIKRVCEENPDSTVLESILSKHDEDSSNREKIIQRNEILKEIADKNPSTAIATIFARTGILGNDSVSDRLKGYTLLSSAELFDTIDDFLSAIKEIQAKEKTCRRDTSTDLHEEDESVYTADKPLVYLSSIHSAKGKQYDRVIIVDCFDEVMPGKPQHDNINYDPEEERRLFYVAITRAKHQLDILTVDKYHGNIEPTSRYVFDLAMICKKIGIPTQHERKEIVAETTPLVFSKEVSTEKQSLESSERKQIQKIFISYSSKERNIADKVKLVLESNGATCWMAPNSISPGSNYTEDIPAAINSSNAMVLILSKAAQQSNWVPKEIEKAINKGVKIIPFQIDNESLTEQFEFLIGQSQRIDAYNRLSDAFEDLVESCTHIKS